MHFFKILHNTVHISINNFLNNNLQKCYIDCRRKPHSIKSERFEGVYWKHWWKISIYNDGAIKHRFISIAPSPSHCWHRVIAPSPCRTIMSTSSHHHVIAPSNQHDGALVNNMALSRFHMFVWWHLRFRQTQKQICLDNIGIWQVNILGNYLTSGGRTNVYQFFSACIHFPLSSGEYQNRENSIA